MTRRLLRQAFEGLEDFRRNALDVGHALHGAGAVAKDGKEQLAALAQSCRAIREADGLAFVLAQGRDGGNRRGGLGGFARHGCGGGFFGHDSLALWAV